MAIDKLHDEFHALDMNTGWEVPALEDQPFEVQARQALANIIAIYAEVLGDHRPAARWCRFRRYITAT